MWDWVDQEIKKERDEKIPRSVDPNVCQHCGSPVGNCDDLFMVCSACGILANPILRNSYDQEETHKKTFRPLTTYSSKNHFTKQLDSLCIKFGVSLDSTVRDNLDRLFQRFSYSYQQIKGQFNRKNHLNTTFVIRELLGFLHIDNSLLPKIKNKRKAQEYVAIWQLIVPQLSAARYSETTFG